MPIPSHLKGACFCCICSIARYPLGTYQKARERMDSSERVPTKLKIDPSSAENELAANFAEMLEHLEPPLTLSCCIYRVPNRLRKLNEEAYTPQAIAIGPFHRGNEKLQTMEKHKLRYLSKFLDRSKTSLESLVRAIERREESIRACYAETIPLRRDEFVKMILMDSSFVIELFLRKFFPGLQDEHDFVLFKPWLQEDIQHDLVLLENQIPFFVIKDLYELAFASSLSDYPNFFELAYRYLKSYNYQDKSPQVEAKHFTDMLRSFYLPWSQSSQPSDDGKIVYIHSATELDGAGVKFKVSSSKCLLDIQLTNEVLEIPCFYVYDRTESLLRNLMAFEQCQYPYNTYICDYIFLMDCLINSDKDVDLLVQEKILVSGLGDNAAVAKLVNDLCRNITLCEGYFFYSRVSEELNAYYDILWHSWNATFIRNYFGNPWIAASTIAAAVLLLLSLIQATCSVISVLQ